MSILGSIFSKILGHGGSTAPTPASATAATTASAAPAPTSGAPQAGASPAAAAAPSASADGGGTASTPVDVAAILTGLAQKNSQTLDWKHSIVDMMKLLGLDSSLSARQTLAQELHYTGDLHDSASMNIWLHKQVMQKLADNGGKVPDELKH